MLDVGDGSWGGGTRKVHAVDETWYVERAESVRYALIITLHNDRKEVKAIGSSGEVIDTVTIPARRTR